MVERKNNKQKNRTKYFLPGGKKQIQAVCAFLFLGVLILSCGVNLIHKDRQMSEKEMRMLAQKPEISLSGIASGRFMEQYEEYVSDQPPRQRRRAPKPPAGGRRCHRGTWRRWASRCCRSAPAS